MRNLINFVVLVIFCAEHFSDALFSGPEQVCCSGTGCFNNSAPYNNLPLPQCFGGYNLDVRLFTRDNRDVGQTINTTTIPSVFDGNRMTMFIVHGWLQGILTGWLIDLKDTILDANDYNVIIVQWDLGSKNLNYAQSCSNTRSVGAYIGYVARNLIQNGGSQRSRLYCVGHSLGAHVCGHAGATEKFGRITGLDPAGPLFEDRDVSAGLNPNCADLVDVIHTDGKALKISFPPLNLGTMGRRGHVDFYPNGGGCQPGCVLDCNITDVFNEDIGGPLPCNQVIRRNEAMWDMHGREGNPRLSLDQLLVGCSHVRAIDYFQESISNPCFRVYYDCDDQTNLPASCTFSADPVQSMGFQANEYSAQGILYVETSQKSPFCIN